MPQRHHSSDDEIIEALERQFDVRPGHRTHTGNSILPSLMIVAAFACIVAQFGAAR